MTPLLMALAFITDLHDSSTDGPDLIAVTYDSSTDDPGCAPYTCD